MTPDTAMMFFIIVAWVVDHGTEDTPQVRQYILNWLAKHDQMQAVYDTKRSQDQVLTDYRTKGFNVEDLRKLHKLSWWERFLQWLKK